MKRIVPRVLPDGGTYEVCPFHVCLKGLEKAVLCRDSQDYDAMVKVLCVSARRCNVIVIIYGVVSNHCHVAVLARFKKDADAYGRDMKKVYSMWFSRKYGERNILRRVEVKALVLTDNTHVRNVLAYIPRNAVDNGFGISEYRWSGFRAMFKDRSGNKAYRPVASLSQREGRAIMHTGDNLKDVPWLLDEEGCLVPESFCDWEYLEQAFNGDQAFFLRVIGGQNSAEMRHELEEKPYQFVRDEEFQKVADETSRAWFGNPCRSLSKSLKVRLIPYLNRVRKTSVSQLARVMGLSREEIAAILGRDGNS